jgi:hypothetical protein
VCPRACGKGWVGRVAGSVLRLQLRCIVGRSEPSSVARDTPTPIWRTESWRNTSQGTG